MTITVPEAVDTLKQGKMIIIVDDENRENEGDLMIAAEKVTPESINFMAREARGLICVSLTEKRSDELELPLMVHDNTSHFQTPFTVSVDAKRNTTTGISAFDRAETIKCLIDPRDPARGPVAARAHLPAARQGRRRAGAHRADRGLARPGPHRRPLPGRRDLRDHEGGRHHGAHARPGRVLGEVLRARSSRSRRSSSTG